MSLDSLALTYNSLATTFDSLTIIVACLLVAVTLRAVRPNRFTTFVFYGVVFGATVALYHYHRQDVAKGWKTARENIVTRVRRELFSDGAGPQFQWPPSLDKPYPDLQLLDQEGRRTSLSEFKGKVILLEPVGIPCRACVAFAGGHQCGPFEGVAPQENLQSIEQYARQYGGADLDDDRLVIVQVLFYSKNLTVPTPEEGRAWAEHFGMDRAKNRVVLVAEPYLLGQATYDMIPGFQLIDKGFNLRYDSTGHQPRHNLFTELLPKVRELVKENRNGPLTVKFPQGEPSER